MTHTYGHSKDHHDGEETKDTITDELVVGEDKSDLKEMDEMAKLLKKRALKKAGLKKKDLKNPAIKKLVDDIILNNDFDFARPSTNDP